jgi:hypothetical protein
MTRSLNKRRKDAKKVKLDLKSIRLKEDVYIRSLRHYGVPGHATATVLKIDL